MPITASLSTSAPATNSSRWSRTNRSLSSEPGSVSARATPSALTASSTVPYAAGPMALLATRPPWNSPVEPSSPVRV